MTKDRAIQIIRCMANGVEPITGEILQDTHLCNQPDVIQALHFAMDALSDAKPANTNPYIRKNGKLNAGRPWTDEDRDALKQLYLNNCPMDAICQKLQRRERGILKQLRHMGLIESNKKPSRKPTLGLERAGLPWLQEEDMHLRELYFQRMPIPQIAIQMQRSEYSIYCRMEKLEFFGTEYGYPDAEDSAHWNTADQRTLREMFLSGKDVDEIASLLEHKPENIRARLHYMKLDKASSASIEKKIK